MRIGWGARAGGSTARPGRCSARSAMPVGSRRSGGVAPGERLLDGLAALGLQAGGHPDWLQALRQQQVAFNLLEILEGVVDAGRCRLLAQRRPVEALHAAA